MEESLRRHGGSSQLGSNNLIYILSALRNYLTVLILAVHPTAIVIGERK
jgi:hypothetical protein